MTGVQGPGGGDGQPGVPGEPGLPGEEGRTGKPVRTTYTALITPCNLQFIQPVCNSRFSCFLILTRYKQSHTHTYSLSSMSNSELYRIQSIKLSHSGSNWSQGRKGRAWFERTTWRNGEDDLRHNYSSLYSDFNINCLSTFTA